MRVIGNRVLQARRGWRGSISIQYIGDKLRCAPNLNGIPGQSSSTRFDGCFVPRGDFTKPKVKFERTVRKANRVTVFVGDLVAFVRELAIAVFAVVTTQSEIAQGVQPSLLDARPLRPQLCLPFIRERLILRQYVFNGVVLHHHSFFATVVFQTAQPVATASEVVEVPNLHIALEFFVKRKAAV